MRFKAVLFDLDGTLFDTAPDIIASCNRTLNAFGLKSLDEDVLRPKVGQGMRAMLRLALPSDRWREAEAGSPMYKFFSESYTENCAQLTRPFTGIEPLINKLHSFDIHLGIISNKYQKMISELFESFTFTKQFEVILGGDSCAHSKPHPEPILTALSKLNIAPADALYVGDAITDIQAAKNAGCSSCAVKWGYARYEGFDIAKSGATFTALDPKDILEEVTK